MNALHEYNDVLHISVKNALYSLLWYGFTLMRR